jgi:hypothetical protein
MIRAIAPFVCLIAGGKTVGATLQNTTIGW